jgi:hypothetical protein
VWERAIVLIASFTGPFSVFVLPALALQLLLLRDFSTRRGMYVAVASGALVQMFYLAHSPRVTAAAIPHEVAPWLQALGQLLSFGSDETGYRLIAAAFWILGAIYVTKWMLDVTRRSGILATLHVVLLRRSLHDVSHWGYGRGYVHSGARPARDVFEIFPDSVFTLVRGHSDLYRSSPLGTGWRCLSPGTAVLHGTGFSVSGGPGIEHRSDHARRHAMVGVCPIS